MGHFIRKLSAGLVGVATLLVGLTCSTASASEPTVVKQATHQYDAGEYTRDYKFDDYLKSGVTDYDDYRSWVSKNVADGLPVVGGFGGLCTYVLKQGSDGHWLAGRNLDTSGVMPSIRVRTRPSNGYASVGNAFVMKASNKGEPSATELKASALAAPYFTADGVNEKGVSTALLALNGFEAPLDSSKSTINQFALTRLVLDHADSVGKAEQLIRQYNVAAFSASGKTSSYGLHLAVADRTGDLAVFEWQGGVLHVTHPDSGSRIVVNTATWSGAAAKDGRFVKAKNYLAQMTGDAATEENLLRVMHQLPSSTPIQWTVVYDLNDMSGIQTSRENADNSFSTTQSFSLDSAPTPVEESYDLWFGDSQMFGYGIKDNTARATKRFSHLVSEADNAIDVNVAVSGTNWTGDTSNRFGYQIDRLIASYEGRNVKRVIGQGVHNDAQVSPAISANSTDAELKAKAQIIADTAKPYYEKLRKAFPNAQLVYIPQVTVWGAAQKSNRFFAAILKTGSYLADDLKQQGWTVMDMQTDLDLIGDHQDYLADSIHVNEKGHAAAAKGIIAWLDTTDLPVGSDAPAATAKVTFNPNGGTGTVNPITFTPGQSITLPDGGGFTRDGYTFSGWNTKADGSGTKVKAGQVVPTQSSTTGFVLYAQWTRDGTEKITVTVNPNGGVLDNPSSTIRIPRNGSISLSTLSASRNGWTLSGWNTAEDGSGTAYPADGRAVLKADTTLYAQWLDLSKATDISRLGEVSIADVLNSDGSSAGGVDGKGVQHDGGLEDESGQLASVSVVMTGTLDHPDGLEKGQLIRIPWGMASGSHYAIGMVSCPNVIEDGKGANDLTIVSCRTDGMVVRVDEGLQGMTRYRFSLTVAQSWIQSSENIKAKTATSNTLNVADDHWTVSNNGMLERNSTNRIDAIQQVNGVGFAATKSSVHIGGWAMQEMKGTDVGSDLNKDMVFVQHVTPASGSTITGITPMSRRNSIPYVTGKGVGDWNSTASWTMGLEQADTTASAISTPALASQTLRKGQWAAEPAGDGSWIVAVNFGPAQGGDSIPDGVSTDDATTNTAINTLKSKNMFGVDASFIFAVNFAGDGISKATVTYDSSTGFTNSNPSPYTLTTSSGSSSAEGLKIGSVAYDGNGGDGDVGTQVGTLGDKVTASQNSYTREGYTFTGWNTRADGTGDTVKPGEQVALTNPGTVLYAQWRKQWSPLDLLPGTGGRSSMVCAMVLAGVLLSLTMAWIVRKRLA